MPESVQMRSVRPPEVAGMFYPGNPEACRSIVSRCLADARPYSLGPSKAIVAPHAGYLYSGPIAGTAFAPLADRRKEIRRVVIIGPAHRALFRGLATTSANAWATPLGSVAVDWPSMGELLSLPCMRVADEFFAGEHSLEVHVPFLQQVLGAFSIIPILVGEASHKDVARTLQMVWGGSETLISVSSDLSHFLDYAAARRLDALTAERIECLQGDEIGLENACGHLALGGTLQRARALDLRVTALDLRNSGDTQGDRGRVVGYGAFAVEHAGAARLAEDQRVRLLAAARSALEFGVRIRKPPDIDLVSSDPWSLRAMRATFITLRIGGRLRGCMGTVAARRPLLLDVAANAYRAGFEDPRFPALSAEELGRVTIEVAVLSTPRPIEFSGEADLVRQLRPGVDGVLLREGKSQSVLLPCVWESVARPDEFVKHLKHKAGLGRDCLPDAAGALRFSVEEFGEPRGEAAGHVAADLASR